MIRIGNLFNSEIFGTSTTQPWGFMFVHSREWQSEYAPLACHPTQIYEALLYFAIFGLTMYLYFVKNMGVKKPGLIFSTTLITIFGGRFAIEMIKNVQVTFEETMRLNMGQILSIPFVTIGLILLYMSLKGKFVSKNGKR